MTKNSILKKLLAIGVGTVCVTTGALFAACDKKDDNNNGGNNPPPIGAHTHQWSTGNEAGAWGSNTTHHWRICLADGHGEQGKTDAEGYGAHVYDNEQDTSCNTCGYKRTIGGGEENPGTPAELTYKVFKVDDITDTSIAVGGSLGTDSGVTIATAAVNIGSNEAAKTSSFHGEDLSLTKYVGLTGSIKTKESLKITVTEKTTVYVYASHSGSGERILGMYDTAAPTDTKKVVEGTTAQAIGNGSGTILGVAKFVVNAGTYYVGSLGSSMNIFAVGLVTGGDVKETSKSHVEGSVADCKDTGIKEHWITDFGMYYSDAQLTTALSPTETILDKTDNHNFVGGTCTVCGKDENAAVTEVNFAKLAGTGDYANGAALTKGLNFGTTWLTVTTPGTAKWKKTATESGLSIKGTTLTVTVTENSELTLVYYSSSAGRKFELKKDGVPYGEGSPTYTKDPNTYTQAAGEYHAAAYANKTVVITLGAGTYTLVFDGNEHKVGSMSCVPKA